MYYVYYKIIQYKITVGCENWKIDKKEHYSMHIVKWYST